MRQLLALCAALLTAAPAIAEIKYQDSGRPWVDHGPALADPEGPEIGRFSVQVWKILPSQKQVIYWNRVTFTSDFLKRLKQVKLQKQNPHWGTPLDHRRPLGPRHVDCNTKAISLVLMEEGSAALVFRQVGEDDELGNYVCRLSGMPSPE